MYKTSNSMKAKQYLKSLCSKSELNDILNEVLLSNIECKIIKEIIVYKKSVLDVSLEVDLSQSSIKKKLKDSLDKIYIYLNRLKFI